MQEDGTYDGHGGKWDPIWFTSFCNDEEIQRIINPQTPMDHLLRKRADVVADNIRFERVYMNKRRNVKNWSFEKSFSDTHYESVIQSYAKNDRNICKQITYGDIFSNDVNGYAWNNDKWGKFISLDESLTFYMKFMNLAIMEFPEEVPLHVRVNAMRIAIRTMLKQEAMDFYMDPRGVVPYRIGELMLKPIRHELQYIAGHEFAHHLCGHLNDINIHKRKVLTVGDNVYYEKVYNTSQLQELEADVDSLLRPHYSSNEFQNVFEAALIWFCSLSLAEIAYDIIDPSFKVKTHPEAIERFDNLINNVPYLRTYSFDKINRIKENTYKMRKILEEDLNYNYDDYDMYGSCYLDQPNTEWRGRQLIDRVDYY